MRDEPTLFESRWPEPGSSIGPWLVVERLDSGSYGVVMQWVEGVTLYEWAQKQPRSSVEVMQVLAEAAWAIDGVNVKAPRRRKAPRAARPQPRKRSNPFLLWLSQASAGLVGGLIVLVILQRTPTPVPRHEPPRAPEREPEIRWVSPILRPQGEKPDAGTTGLGDAGTDDRSLASLQDTPSAGIAPQKVGRSMPPMPFNNQRKPPCEPRIETAINGGCWILIGRMDPPCGAKAFEWEGQCYTPSFDVLRQPTSGEP